MYPITDGAVRPVPQRNIGFFRQGEAVDSVFGER